MQQLAVAANKYLETNKKTADSEVSVTALVPARSLSGRYSSWTDYSIEWPEAGDETFEITFTPDLAKDLTDPRLRTVTFNRSSEILAVDDSYPGWHNALWLTAVLAIGAVFGGLVYLGTRPNVGIDRLHGRITAKKAESEYEAAKFMSRLR